MRFLAVIVSFLFLYLPASSDVFFRRALYRKYRIFFFSNVSFLTLRWVKKINSSTMLNNPLQA